MPAKQDSVKVIQPGAPKVQGGPLAIASAVVAATAAVTLTRFFDSRSPDRKDQPDKNRADEDRGDKDPVNDDTVVKEKDGTGPFDYEAAGVEPGKENSIKGKIVTFGKKHNWRWFGRTLQVQNRYGELNGNNLAAAVTLQTFLALIPLLVIATSVVGFFASGSAGSVTSQITSFLGITDPSAQETIAGAIDDAQQTKGWAAVIGFLSLLWSALGVSAALQYAYNQAWQTNNRGIKDKAVGLGWMLGAAILFAASAGVSIVVGVADDFLPAGLGVLGVIVGICVTFVLWLFTALVLPNVKVSWRAVVPGAIVGTVGLELIKYLASAGAGAIGGASNGAYGAVGAVLGILAALFIFGRLVVYSAVTNVVLYEAKHGTVKASIEMPTPAPVGAAGVARAGQTDS